MAKESSRGWRSGLLFVVRSDRLRGSSSDARSATKAATRRRLQSLAEGKGMKVFAVIDHSGEAEKVGGHDDSFRA
jgi:hypothetical protein